MHKHTTKEVGFMIKIGYYPILDTVLTIRQIFSIERFKPFCHPLENVNTRLPKEAKKAINDIATLTQDWLDVIENLITYTIEGVTSPEELFIEASKNPNSLFGAKGNLEMVALLSSIYYNYCFIEIAKYSKQINEKAMEVSSISSKDELINYILRLSDRLQLEDNGYLRFNIKPDLVVHKNDIRNIIVMPSVFSSRNIAFWYKKDTFLFYVGLDSKAITLEEPSDMLLLRTLAFNDKTRLKMLRFLTASAHSVNQMAEKMNINPSTVSRHFKVFKDVGFVDVQSQEGNSIYYNINEEEIKKALQSIYEYVIKGETK